MKKSTFLFLLSLTFFSCTKKLKNHHIQIIEKSTTVTTDKPTEKEILKLKKQIALDFINGYVKNQNNRKNSLRSDIWIENSNLASQWLKTTTKAFYSSTEYIDFDPIFNAQDYPEQGYEIESIKNDIVIVRGINFTSLKDSIKLIKFEDRWLVNNIGIFKNTPHFPSKKRNSNLKDTNAIHFMRKGEKVLYTGVETHHQNRDIRAGIYITKIDSCNYSYKLNKIVNWKKTLELEGKLYLSKRNKENYFLENSFILKDTIQNTNIELNTRNCIITLGDKKLLKGQLYRK